jgi:hypothetical protein
VDEPLEELDELLDPVDELLPEDELLEPVVELFVLDGSSSSEHPRATVPATAAAPNAIRAARLKLGGAAKRAAPVRGSAPRKVVRQKGQADSPSRTWRRQAGQGRRMLMVAFMGAAGLRDHEIA